MSQCRKAPWTAGRSRRVARDDPEEKRGGDRGLALARNGRDWHTLLEFRGLVGTLIADEDGVYDPRLPNDRLLLGMKRTAT